MRKLVFVVGVLSAFSIAGSTEASTIVDIGAMTLVVPQNGTIELGGLIAPGSQGTFDVVGNPSFTGSGFAVLTRTAMVDGASFSIQTALGTCPVAACGPFPFVTDNVFGAHLGPGGFSTFPISNLDPELTISSNWTLQEFFPGSNIAIPSDYNVEISVFLPTGIAAIPEPSTWAMLILGFVGIGTLSCFRSRKAMPAG